MYKILSVAILCCSGIIARGQLTVEQTGLFVKEGTILSVDRLLLTPSTDMLIQNNAISVSAVSVPSPATGSNGIERVYHFSDIVQYEGTLGIRYLAGELNGNSPAQLALIYQDQADQFIFTNLATQTAVDEYVEGNTTAAITLKKITAVNTGEPEDPDDPEDPDNPETPVSFITTAETGLFVKEGTILSIDRLLLTPVTDMLIHNNTISVSAIPVPSPTPGSNGSIERVYHFSDIVQYEGTLSIRYLADELNGNSATQLVLIYQDQADQFIVTNLATQTAVDEYVEGNTTAAVTLKKITAVNAGVALPVKLVSFTATAENDKARIEWKTTMELNVSHFEVERATDGIDFSKLLTVQSAGNENTGADYKGYDEEPLSGWNYYRLKTIDKDGSAAYSSIARLFFENVSQVNLFPNPASATIALSMNAGRAGKDVYTIVDITGKKLMEKTVILERGTNRFTIDVSTLRAGTYILYMQSGYVGKLVKQ